jgi:hypothetical protein
MAFGAIQIIRDNILDNFGPPSLPHVTFGDTATEPPSPLCGVTNFFDNLILIISCSILNRFSLICGKV